MRAAFTTILLHLSSKVKRQRSGKAPTSNDNSQIKKQLSNRPPAPLPEPQTDQHNAEVIYCEPEQPRPGSVDSLELPSSDRRPNSSLKERQQSSRPGRVIPRPPRPSHAIDTREGSLGETQPLPLSKELTSLTCMSSYESLLRSAPEVAIPQRVEQLTVANTASATESSHQHSTQRTMNYDASKLESAEISALSQDQDIDSASGYAPKVPQKICISPLNAPISSPVVRGEQEPPGKQNESYVKDTILNSDKSASAVSADTANHSSYSNLPPPLVQRRHKRAESDACMIPSELLSESVDIDNLSPSESNYYLECLP